MSRRHRLFAAGLDLVHALRLHRLPGRGARGLGVILTLHRVRPFAGDDFAPNRLLEIEPGFLDAALGLIRARGYRLTTLDGARDLIARPDGGPPFAALTFDDGYRDTRDHALPVLERHGAPATLFAVPGFLDRAATLWWVDLEEAVRRLDRVRIVEPDLVLDLPARDAPEKTAAFAALYAPLRAGPEGRLRRVIADLAARAGIDPTAIVADACLDWDELARLSAHPLIAVGAHTLTHPFLAQCDDATAAAEMAGSRDRLAAALGRSVPHIAYPVGDAGSAGPRDFALARELGFDAGVTTRPGVVVAEHAAHLHALPRISLNGLFQQIERLDALLTGLPTLAYNRGRFVNVA